MITLRPTLCAWCSGPVNPAGTGSLVLVFRDMPGDPGLAWHVGCASRDPILRWLMKPRSCPASDAEVRLTLAMAEERWNERGGSHGRS